MHAHRHTQSTFLQHPSLSVLEQLPYFVAVYRLFSAFSTTWHCLPLCISPTGKQPAQIVPNPLSPFHCKFTVSSPSLKLLILLLLWSEHQGGIWSHDNSLLPEDPALGHFGAIPIAKQFYTLSSTASQLWEALEFLKDSPVLPVWAREIAISHNFNFWDMETVQTYLFNRISILMVCQFSNSPNPRYWVRFKQKTSDPLMQVNNSLKTKQKKKMAKAVN